MKRTDDSPRPGRRARRAVLASPLFLLLPLLLAAGPAACGGDEESDRRSDDFVPLQRDPSFPGTRSDAHEAYFATAGYTDPGCSGSFADLDREREMYLFQNPGGFLAEEYTRGLQRYFQRVGLALFTLHPPLDIPMTWVFDDDELAVLDHLARKFPDIDFFDENAQVTEEQFQAVAREATSYMLRPMIDFARTYGDQGPAMTHLVLLPSITKLEALGRAQGFMEDATVIGLGISPVLLELFRSEDTPEGQIWRSFPLDDFTPMFFINAGALTQMVEEHGFDPVLIDLTMAHEMGHTLGLEHLDIEHNLMHPGFEDPDDITCDTSLTEEQLERIGQTLDAAPSSRAKPAPADAAARERQRQQAWRLLQDHLLGKRKLRLFH